jgi:hypothetical protein
MDYATIACFEPELTSCFSRLKRPGRHCLAKEVDWHAPYACRTMRDFDYYFEALAWSLVLCGHYRGGD